MLGLDNPIHIAFLLILLLLVFGAKRLPEMGRSLGSGMRGFKEALGGEGAQKSLSAPASAPAATSASTAPAAVPAAATAVVPAAANALAPVDSPALATAASPAGAPLAAAVHAPDAPGQEPTPPFAA